MPPPRRRPARLIAACLVVCAGLLAVAAPALAVRPFIHAHRGGSIEFGTPTYPENTLPAFRASARARLRARAGREAHQGPRAGGDPRRHARPHHAVHRPGERAHLRASCAPTAGRTSSAPTGNFVQLAPNDRRRAPIPKLSEVLALARHAGVRVNLEIKNQPDRPGLRRALRLRRPRDRRDQAVGLPAVAADHPVVLVPEPRTVRRRLLPDAETSYLTLGAGEPGLSSDGRERRLDLGPVARGRRDASGRRTRSACAWCPFTIDARADIAAAVRAGVDELITNDPLLARKTEAELDPGPAPIPPPPSAAACAPRRARPHARHDRGLRIAPPRRCACSRCSPSRRPATSRPTRASAPRSSA